MRIWSWSANSIEPGQSLHGFAGWPGFILMAKANHFHFSRIRVNLKKSFVNSLIIYISIRYRFWILVHLVIKLNYLKECYIEYQNVWHNLELLNLLLIYWLITNAAYRIYCTWLIHYQNKMLYNVLLFDN